MNIVKTNLNITGQENRATTRRIILHHAAGNTSVTAIHNQHRRQDWGGIGYHYLVDKDGTIYTGRPENTVGAHATNNNQDSIGICFNGNFETETMSSRQREAGKQLIAHLRSKYGIAVANVIPHRNVTPTACPGRNFPHTEIVAPAQMSVPTTRGGFENMNRREIEAVIADMYFSLMQRKADTGGLKYWADKAQGGMSFIDIYKAMSGSEEMVTKFVTDILYRGLLKRNPDKKGLEGHVKNILEGRATKESTHAAFLNSEEYKLLKKNKNA